MSDPNKIPLSDKFLAALRAAYRFDSSSVAQAVYFLLDEIDRLKAAGPPDIFDLPEITVHEMEKRMVIAAFVKYDGNRKQMAASTGIAVRTLAGKLRKYGFEPRQKIIKKDELCRADRIV